VTCEEFRRRWLDVQPRPATAHRSGEWATRGPGDVRAKRADSPTRPFAPSDEDSGAWEAHPDVCSSCAAWERSQLALDEALASALLVTAPPDLSARLAQIPAMISRTETVTSGQRVLELVFLVVVALGVIGLSGMIGTIVMGAIWPIADDVLQAMTLVLDSPLVGYAQSLASTLLEALATLTLVVLVVLQARPRRSAT
jgi:hypothetical protein